MGVINWELIKHPMNWLIVILMILIAGIFVHLVLDLYGVKSAESQN